MNTADAEKIMAFHDNELVESERAAVEQLLAHNKEAQEFLSALQSADELATSEFDALLNEPVPQRLIDAARGVKPGTNKVVSLPLRKRLTNNWNMAIAAGFVLAAGLGISLSLLQTPKPSESTQYANLLQSALTEIPSGQARSSADKQWQLMPIASYAVDQQGLCREYAGAFQGQSFYGLACQNSQGHWQTIIDSSIAATNAASGDTQYTPASGETGAIDKALQQLGSYRVLDEDEEKTALSSSR